MAIHFWTRESPSFRLVLEESVSWTISNLRQACWSNEFETTRNLNAANKRVHQGIINSSAPKNLGWEQLHMGNKLHTERKGAIRLEGESLESVQQSAGCRQWYQWGRGMLWERQRGRCKCGVSRPSQNKCGHWPCQGLGKHTEHAMRAQTLS